jgi:hypothetical protein
LSRHQAAGSTPPKTGFDPIKLIDKDIDRPERIILRQIVFQPPGK